MDKTYGLGHLKRHMETPVSASKRPARRKLRLGQIHKSGTLAQRLKDDVARRSGVSPVELQEYDNREKQQSSRHASVRETSGGWLKVPVTKTEFAASIRGRVSEARTRRAAMRHRIEEQEQAAAVRRAERYARRVVRDALKHAVRGGTRSGLRGADRGSPVASAEETPTPAGRVFVPFQGRIGAGQGAGSEDEFSTTTDGDDESDSGSSQLSYPSQHGWAE